MSWQAYVDTTLVGSGNIDKAAIISVDGKSVWAISAGFTIHPNEREAICSVLGATNATKADASKQTTATQTDASKQAAVTNAQQNGVHLNSERFVVTRAEGRSLYGRKGREGICAVQTNQAIIVGHYNEGQQAGGCTVAVEGLADYLVGQGY